MLQSYEGRFSVTVITQGYWQYHCLIEHTRLTIHLP